MQYMLKAKKEINNNNWITICNVFWKQNKHFCPRECLTPNIARNESSNRNLSDSCRKFHIYITKMQGSDFCCTHEFFWPKIVWGSALGFLSGTLNFTCIWGSALDFLSGTQNLTSHGQIPKLNKELTEVHVDRMSIVPSECPLTLLVYECLMTLCCEARCKVVLRIIFPCAECWLLK